MEGKVKQVPKDIPNFNPGTEKDQQRLDVNIIKCPHCGAEFEKQS